MLLEESGEIHITDNNREVVTIMKTAKSMVRYTAVETIDGSSLVAASSDALISFFQPDPHDLSPLRRVSQLYTFNTTVVNSILYLPKTDDRKYEMLLTASDCTVALYINQKNFICYQFITAHDFDFTVERMQLTFTNQIAVIDSFNFHVWEPFKVKKEKLKEIWDDKGQFKTVKKDH